MAAQDSRPPVAFGNAFDRLRDQVTTDDARLFASTTIEDVWDTARQIEIHLEKRGSLRGFKRIEPFLAGIEQYSKVVEVLCNGTPYLPWIWAPIKLLLQSFCLNDRRRWISLTLWRELTIGLSPQIAQGHISALEKLIDAYAMIAEAMPRFDRLSAAFKDDEELRQVMGLFYADVLEFHRRAYKYFRQRAWKILFDSLWKNFNFRFQGILERLRKHRDLVDQEAHVTDIVESKAWRTRQIEDMRQWRTDREDHIIQTEKDRLSRQIREAVTWLGAREEQEDTLNRISSACEGSHWALGDPQLMSWLDQGGGSQVLWLNGNPGAGKSVVCSKIIEVVQHERVQDKKTSVPLFFFCQHDYVHQNSTDILRTFAAQLLAANTSELAPYILETWADHGLRPSKKVLQEILKDVMDSVDSTRVIVDGLDEWPRIEQEEILRDLLMIKERHPGRCKILISSRRLPAIGKLLSSKPTFCLEEHQEDVRTTISAFVSLRLRALEPKLNKFNAALMDELKRNILAKADGMFLWVKLVIYTLEESHFEKNIREAIDTLPDGLDDVYERIISRMCGDAKTSNQCIAIRILQWLLIAKRPLKREELENGIVLDEQVPRMTSFAKPLGDVLSLCYPLINVEDRNSRYVSFFHFTVVEHLKRNMLYLHAQPLVSLSCVLSLNSGLDLVDPRVAEREKIAAVLTGLHDLLFYASDYFIDHLTASTGSREGLERIVDALRSRMDQLALLHDEINILRAHKVLDEDDPYSTEDAVLWDSLGFSDVSRRLLVQTSEFGKTQSKRKSPKVEWQKTHDPTLFSAIRAKYQTIVENLLEIDDPSDEALEDFQKNHRSGNFLCRFHHCPRASQGFDSSRRREEHEATHKARFKCNDLTCGFTGWTFESRDSMRRHINVYHKKKAIAQIPSTIYTEGLPQNLRDLRNQTSFTPLPKTIIKKHSDYQDYQMQLRSLEQQNKERLLWARQGQNTSSSVVDNGSREMSSPKTEMTFDDLETERPIDGLANVDINRNPEPKHNLIDWQAKLLHLEQKNKRRLLMARREQSAVDNQATRGMSSPKT